MNGYSRKEGEGFRGLGGTSLAKRPFSPLPPFLGKVTVLPSSVGRARVCKNGICKSFEPSRPIRGFKKELVTHYRAVLPLSVDEHITKNDVIMLVQLRCFICFHQQRAGLG